MADQPADDLGHLVGIGGLPDSEPQADENIGAHDRPGADFFGESGFFLANYSVVLCSALHTASEGVMTLVIITTNMGITLFIFMIGALPSLYDHLQDPTPVWNSTFWTVLGVEFATLVITLSLPYFVAARRRDFI